LHDVQAIIRQVEERGFCKVPNVIPLQKADAARTVLDGLLKAEATEQTRQAGSQRVGRIAVKDPIFIELMCNPLVLEVWKTWLGEDIICSSWTANTMYPGHQQIGWHADYPYWSKKPPWPMGNMAGQTLWMLDDFTEENGATGGLPYSHLKGHPPDGQTDAWRDDGEILTGQKGSVVFAHGAWWHTARPNNTDQPRSCLLGMYIMPWFFPQEDMRSQLAEIENPSELVRRLMCDGQYVPSNVG
jgi:ectoine hydroxylase-related dioxygenase (phytanoyl-CoA dioxygenase family)